MPCKRRGALSLMIGMSYCHYCSGRKWVGPGLAELGLPSSGAKGELANRGQNLTKNT